MNRIGETTRLTEMGEGSVRRISANRTSASIFSLPEEYRPRTQGDLPSAKSTAAQATRPQAFQPPRGESFSQRATATGEDVSAERNRPRGEGSSPRTKLFRGEAERAGAHRDSNARLASPSWHSFSSGQVTSGEATRVVSRLSTGNSMPSSVTVSGKVGQTMAQPSERPFPRERQEAPAMRERSAVGRTPEGSEDASRSLSRSVEAAPQADLSLLSGNRHADGIRNAYQGSMPPRRLQTRSQQSMSPHVNGMGSPLSGQRERLERPAEGWLYRTLTQHQDLIQSLERSQLGASAVEEESLVSTREGQLQRGREEEAPSHGRERSFALLETGSIGEGRQASPESVHNSTYGMRETAAMVTRTLWEEIKTVRGGLRRHRRVTVGLPSGETLSLSLQRNGERVSLRLESASPLAQGALREAWPQLQKLAREGGLTLQADWQEAEVGGDISRLYA